MNKYWLIISFILSSMAGSEPGNKIVSPVQVNQDAEQALKHAEKQMQRYLDKSRERYRDDKVVLKSIDGAQQAWAEYADAQCSSVYLVWRDGSVRTDMTIWCKINLTQERTHVLWSQYLTYMDNTPPLLPEPIVDKRK